MKKTLITLLALGGIAMGSSITLDSGKGNNNTSLYQDIIDGANSWGDNNRGTITTSAGNGITFYLEVKDLFGASALKDDTTYTLDSFSYVGNDWGYYTGPDRTWTLSNGTDTVTFSQEQASNNYCTTTFTSQATDAKPLLTFEKNDILTLTLTPPSNGSVEVKYYDTQAPGVSFTMKNGEVNDGIDYTINPGTTNWKYNTPAVRLTATAVVAPSPTVPEPTTATLSLLALAGLAARRRRR